MNMTRRHATILLLAAIAAAAACGGAGMKLGDPVRLLPPGSPVAGLADIGAERGPAAALAGKPPGGFTHRSVSFHIRTPAGATVLVRRLMPGPQQKLPAAVCRHPVLLLLRYLHQPS